MVDGHTESVVADLLLLSNRYHSTKLYRVRLSSIVPLLKQAHERMNYGRVFFYPDVLILPSRRYLSVYFHSPPPFIIHQVCEDWKFIGRVLDRLFLILFTIAVLGGTGWIILRAPSLYDMREPLGIKISSIPRLF